MPYIMDNNYRIMRCENCRQQILYSLKDIYYKNKSTDNEEYIIFCPTCDYGNKIEFDF